MIRSSFEIEKQLFGNWKKTLLDPGQWLERKKEKYLFDSPVWISISNGMTGRLERSRERKGLRQRRVLNVQLKRGDDAFADRNRGNDHFVRLLSRQQWHGWIRDSCQTCHEEGGGEVVSRAPMRAPIKSDQSKNTSPNLFGQIAIPPTLFPLPFNRPSISFRFRCVESRSSSRLFEIVKRRDRFSSFRTGAWKAGR